MSKILVTGGAGYIGATAATLLIDAGYEVNILDDLSTGHRDSLDSRAVFIEGSILDKSAIRTALEGCEAVMHFAGKSLVGESVEKPDLYIQVNVEGTANLLEVMKEQGVTKIVFSSSAATYGEPIEIPVTEEAACLPTNPYGLSKLKVDQMLASNTAISAISLRYFNVAGAHNSANGWLAERHNPETHLIPNVLRATVENPLKLFGTDWQTADGTCVRDYIHVVDLIDAHIKALKILKPNHHEIINLGSGDGYSVRQVIETANEVLGRRVPIVEVARRAGDPAVLVACITKAKRVLGWTPSRDMRAMISDTAASFKSN